MWVSNPMVGLRSLLLNEDIPFPISITFFHKDEYDIFDIFPFFITKKAIFSLYFSALCFNKYPTLNPDNCIISNK